MSDDNQDSSRKRARVDDDDGSTTNRDPRLGWKRHETFFKEDGDCYLLAEKTLFKIHRFMLIRDSEVFKTMFSLPSPEGSKLPLESRSESHPLVIPDTAADFSALCWVLYALPMQIEEFVLRTSFPAGVVSKIISVFAICNKYQLTSYEKWAGNTISKRMEDPAGSFALACKDSEFKRLLEIANATNMDGLTKNVAQAWIHQLKVRPSSLKFALDTAEALGYRWFEGQVYYTAASQFDGKGYPNPNSAAAMPQHFSFSEKQKNRLYHGIAALGISWIFSVKAVPPCASGGMVDFQHRMCIKAWNDILASQQNRHPKNMVVAFEIYLASSEICTTSRDSITASLEFAKRTMADHFFGVPAP